MACSEGRRRPEEETTALFTEIRFEKEQRCLKIRLRKLCSVPTANVTFLQLTSPFMKSTEHFETEHALVDCKCNMKIEKNQLEKHENMECPLRLVKCQYCELELAFNKSQEHADYCGSRTEPCTACGRNVLVKDLNIHHITCGKDVEEKNNNRMKPGSEFRFEENIGTWFENHPFGNLHRAEENRIRPRPRISRQLETKVHVNRETVFPVRGPDRRNMPIVGRDQNQANITRIERNRVADPAGPGHVDANSNLDYLLALSLQNENSGGEGDWPPLWEDTHTDYRRPELQSVVDLFNNRSSSNVFPTSVNVHEEIANDVTMLPCEFCEELFPEGELILHQEMSDQIIFLIGIILSSQDQLFDLQEASELRRLTRKPLEPSGGSTRPIGDVFPESYKPTFPHVPAARSSLRTEGSRISRNTVPPTSRSRVPGIKQNIPKKRPENDGKEEE
ncbi:hypothetical protein scyTo_0003469 [Scyliorhinus torazame]|uniref:TRAF-type zinc finger domain-containing protein 1 n=1 Tax=Scyliorhinus torazame TaxID=75743 RepID=A0A401PMN8_SCYTO|nr:hypothetical protein [Scyliorhinus torazame]